MTTVKKLNVKRTSLDTNKFLTEEIQRSIKNINNAQYAICTTARVLREIFIERACDDTPEWCKSDYLVGGLITAIDFMSRRIDADITQIQEGTALLAGAATQNQ